MRQEQWFAKNIYLGSTNIMIAVYVLVVEIEAHIIGGGLEGWDSCY